MSEVLDSSDVRAEPTSTADRSGRETPPSSPVKVWALVGAAVLALELYVWISWISGPYFTHVSSGPSDPPTLMKVMLTIQSVAVWVGLPIAVWFWVIKPWVRERRISLNAMLMAAMGLMFFQDPLLNYFNTWCTYNSWLFNRGSWSSNIPGWISPESPGHQVPEPLLTNVPGYTWGVLLCTIFLLASMRQIKRRWPHITTFRMVLVTYAMAIAFDFVMEGCIILPMGFYSYPGAIRSLSINAGHYYQWPIYEGLMWGAVETGLACLKFFTDDRERTFVERGLENVRGGFATQQFVRFLAIFAAVSACFFVFYNVPAQWIGMHSDPWPKDVLERSYFTQPVCGEGSGSDRACPDPSLPVPTKRSGYVNTKGQLVMPEGTSVPTTVPFATDR
jgi:hypothetical protein